MRHCREAWPPPHARLRASRREESPKARLRASRRPQRTKAIARVDKILLRAAHRSCSEDDCLNDVVYWLLTGTSCHCMVLLIQCSVKDQEHAEGQIGLLSTKGLAGGSAPESGSCAMCRGSCSSTSDWPCPCSCPPGTAHSRMSTCNAPAPLELGSSTQDTPYA